MVSQFIKFTGNLRNLIQARLREGEQQLQKKARADLYMFQVSLTKKMADWFCRIKMATLSVMLTMSFVLGAMVGQ